MGYAIRNDGLGWRAIDSAADLLEDESYSEEQPPVLGLSSISQEVTRFQARAALYQSGLLEAVEAEIAKPETDMMLKLAWQDALSFKRNSSFVTGMAAILELSEEQLDQLFVLAAGIE